MLKVSEQLMLNKFHPNKYSVECILLNETVHNKFNSQNAL